MLKKMRRFQVYYKSRYYPLEGSRKRIVFGVSAADIRTRWHAIIETDEYKIVKCVLLE